MPRRLEFDKVTSCFVRLTGEGGVAVLGGKHGVACIGFGDDDSLNTSASILAQIG